MSGGIAALARVRIVLVETSHPGNIGAAARAMKNMGLGRLTLVAPRRFPDAEATARASGADDILQRARVVPDLAAALADCSLVAGATARLRTISSPVLAPREAGTALLEAAAGGAEVALVFGRERSGLTNAEMARCHYLVQIPTAPGFSSLNLAQAVQVLAYELLLAAGAPRPRPPDQDAYPPATSEQMEGFFRHLEQVLYAVGFLKPPQSRTLMRRLRRLFLRARPDCNEINILRGILSAVDEREE